jgi:hypothetical protein
VNHDWQRTGVAQAHCARCGAHTPFFSEREIEGCKEPFRGIPQISATLEGNTVHLRNDGDAPARVTGAVFGYVDDQGNFVAEKECSLLSIESTPRTDAQRAADAALDAAAQYVGPSRTVVLVVNDHDPYGVEIGSDVVMRNVVGHLEMALLKIRRAKQGL